MRSFAKLPIIFTALLAVSACENIPNGTTIRPSMYEPTMVSQRNITLEEQHFVEKLSQKEVDFTYLETFTKDYNYSGNSPVYAVFTYDPDDKNGKLKAFNKSNIVKGQLAKLGVKNTVLKTMPVKDGQDEIVIGYDKLIAKGPQNCGQMVDHQSDTVAMSDYGLGCTLKDKMAQQIAYPADLQGQSDMMTFDADRSAIPVARDAHSATSSAFVPSYILSSVGG